jgi:hypothetical protein
MHAAGQLTHGDAEQADNQLDRGHSIENGRSLGLGVNKPVKCPHGETTAENVLEDDHAGEPLNGQVT